MRKGDVVNVSQHAREITEDYDANHEDRQLGWYPFMDGLLEQDVEVVEFPTLMGEGTVRIHAPFLAGDPKLNKTLETFVTLPVDAVSPIRKESTVKVADNSYSEDSKPPRRFYMQRMKDETGVSRTGRVIEGVLFQDGHVVVQWRPPLTSIAIYEGFEEFLAIHYHSHPSCNKIVWIDKDEDIRQGIWDQFILVQNPMDIKEIRLGRAEYEAYAKVIGVPVNDDPSPDDFLYYRGRPCVRRSLPGIEVVVE